MDAKLAAYRAKKAQERNKQEKKETVWKWITLEGLRQRFRWTRLQPSGDVVTSDGEEEPDFEDEIPWTKLDWIILAVKLMIWFCLQVLFAKFEFGAVFFVTSCFSWIYLYGFASKPRRSREELSAYSVFNKNCETLQGTLTAEQFDKEIRHKM